MHDGKDIKNKFLKSWKNDLSIAWFSYNISAYNLNLSESVQKSQTLIPEEQDYMQRHWEFLGRARKVHSASALPKPWARTTWQTKKDCDKNFCYFKPLLSGYISHAEIDKVSFFTSYIFLSQPSFLLEKS